MTRVVDRGPSSKAAPEPGRRPGQLSNAGIDRLIDGMIVVFLGFVVPLVSLFRGHWLEYFLPVGLLFSFLHLLRRGVLWRDYFKHAHWGVFVAVGGFIFVGFIAALRVYDPTEMYESLRAVMAPVTVYLSFYGVIFFVMISGSALSARILKALMWGTIVTFTLLALEPFTGIASEWIFPLAGQNKPFSLAHFNRTFLALAMFSWLAAPWLTRKVGYGAIGIVPPVAVWLLNFTGESDTVTLGLVVAVAVYLVALWRPRWVLHTMFGFTLLVLVSAPLLYSAIFEFFMSLGFADNFGIMTRAEIWDAVARFITNAPIFGHGMNSTLRLGPLDFANMFYKDRIIYHPHNGFLQAWADMGLVGALALAGVLWAMWRGLAGLSDDRLPHILALFCFGVIAFLTTHPLWASWWLGMLAMAIAYAVATSGTVALGRLQTSGAISADPVR